MYFNIGQEIGFLVEDVFDTKEQKYLWVLL